MDKTKWNAFYNEGMKNPWANGSAALEDGNPIVEEDRLNKHSVIEISSEQELKQFFKRGNYTLGTSVIHEDFCFIEQTNGNGEWLVLKYDSKTKKAFAFESWSVDAMIQDGEFEKYLHRIKQATNEQLRRLEY